MKKLIAVLACCLACQAVCCQTFAEWFKQKKTQKKYSLAQVFALEAYRLVLQQGYRTTGDSLLAINSSKQKDNRQHQDYYHALRTIAPAVKRYHKVAIAYDQSTRIRQVCSTTKQIITATKWLNQQEKAYTGQILTAAVADCNENIAELAALTTDEVLEMKADARLRRIDAITSNLQSIYGFVQGCSKAIRLLMMQRQQTDSNSRKILQYYGVE